MSPQKIRKRSDYVNNYVDTVKVPGERETTNTGYRVSSFKNGSFETYYEVMLPGTSTNRYRHEKKDKVVWVTAGQGFLELQVGEESPVTRRLIPGDHVVIPRDSSWRIATTSQQNLEILVTQQAKYEASLELLESTETSAEAAVLDLVEPTLDERMTSVIEFGRRRGSKAAEQQALMQATRGDGSVVTTRTVSASQLGFNSGKNPKPTGGRFDDAGAG